MFLRSEEQSGSDSMFQLYFTKEGKERPTFAPKLALDLVQGQLKSGSSKSWPSNGFNRATKASRAVFIHYIYIYLIDCSICYSIKYRFPIFRLTFNLWRKRCAVSNRLFLDNEKSNIIHFFHFNVEEIVRQSWKKTLEL